MEVGCGLWAVNECASLEAKSGSLVVGSLLTKVERVERLPEARREASWRLGGNIPKQA